MTTIEPMVPVPEGPLLPATVAPAFPRNRTTAAMPLVRVNLLPDEVVASRRGHRTRRIVLAALVLLVVVLVAVSFFVRSGIGDATGELDVAQAANASLTAQQGQYAAAVAAQSDLKAAVGRLGDLSATDVAWAPLITAVNAVAPAGVALAGVAGTTGRDSGVPDSGAAGSAGGAPGGTGTPGATAMGTIVVTGVAPSPATVAAYVDALSKVKGLTTVVATGVVASVQGYAFGIGAVVTDAALSHRFGTEGGK